MKIDKRNQMNYKYKFLLQEKTLESEEGEEKTDHNPSQEYIIAEQMDIRSLTARVIVL